MPGSDHSGAWVGLWKRAVASNTARPAAGRVGGRQLAPGDAVGDDPGQLAGEVVDVGRDHPAGVGGQLEVGGEQLRVLAGQLRLAVTSSSSQRRSRSGAGPASAATAASGVEMRASQRSVTASRSAALLGKCR